VRPSFFSFLVLSSYLSGAIGCQSIQKAMFDDDCSTTRLTFWDSETGDDLPSPKEASEEALLWMKDNERQLLAARGSSFDGMEDGMHLAPDHQDWAMGETQVFVPELLQREYFVKRSTQDDKGLERRKPLFAKSRFGVQAVDLDHSPFLPTVALQARVGVPKSGALAMNNAMSSYEVMPGDTLGTISKKLYGTPGRWMELAHLNHLGNGSLIYPKEILFYIKDSQVIGQH
jgi:hypothetical protein